MKIIAELQRRNVFRVSVAYAVLAWLVIQVADTVAPALSLPEWTLTFVIWLGIIGFPFVVLISWMFQLTPAGLVRDEGTEVTGQHSHSVPWLNAVIVSFLCLALVLVIVDSYILDSKTGSGTGSYDSVAVLPFVNMSGDQSQEYFSDGLSEELLNLLARIDGLKVAARTSSFAFKGRNEDIRGVGDALGVSTVLEGSVRRSGSRLRVTAQLIDVETGYHLWSDNFDREMVDVFAIQDQIASAIVEALQVHLDTGEPLDVAAAQVTNLEAYDLYLKGLEKSRLMGTQRYREALEYFRAATEADPNFAAAWAARARMVVLLRETAFWGDIPQSEVIVLARQSIRNALDLDPRQAEAYLAQAMLAADLYRYEDAFASLEKSLALSPNHAESLGFLATLQARVGRIKQARENSIKALALDPLHRRFQAVAEEILVLYTDDPAELDRGLALLPAERATALKLELLRGKMTADTLELMLSNPEMVFLQGMVKIRWLKEYDRELLDQRGRYPGEFALWSYIDGGRWDEAEELWQQLEPGREEAVINLEQLSIMQAALGQCEDALLTLDQAHHGRVPIYGMLGPNSSRANSNLAANRVYCLQKLGRDEEAEAILSDIEPYLATFRANTGIGIALLDAKFQYLRGKPDAAVQVLAAGFERGELFWDVLYDPVLQNLAGDPGFDQFIADWDRRIDQLRADMGMPPADF